MTFDEMKRVWLESESTEDGLDTDDLRARAEGNAASSEVEASVTEIGLASIFVMMALIAGIDAIVDRESWYSYVSPAVSLAIASFVWTGRSRRLRQSRHVEETLRGYLKQSIRNMESHILRTRRFVWWFVLPSFAGLAVSMAHEYGGRPLWVWLSQPLAIIVFWVALRVGVMRHYLPRKLSLESLLSRLESP